MLVAVPATNVPATPEQVKTIKVQRLPYKSAIKAIGGPATPCMILTELITQVALGPPPTVLQERNELLSVPVHLGSYTTYRTMEVTKPVGPDYVTRSLSLSLEMG
jgi:hypothetical protein